MGMGNSVTVTVDAQDRTSGGIGSSTRTVKTLGDAADVTARQLKQMDGRLDDAAVKARRLAEAEERAAAKTRDMIVQLAGLRTQLERDGDATGELGRKMDRLAVNIRVSANATDDYRRKANRASEDAREQARAYDRVAENAREAARAVALLGASTRLGGGGGGGFGGAFSAVSGGFLKNGFGGASAGLEGALGTPVVGPALLAGGAAAAIPAASFAGATFGGGALAGLGLGGAAGGLAGAWMGDPEKYGGQWTSMIDRVKKRWIDSSRAFGDELDGALKTAGNTLERLPVERVLALSQGFVAPIVTGAGQGSVAAANGLADALERVQPVIDEIGPKIGNFGADVGDAFRMISEGSEGGAHALGDFIDLMGYAVKVAGLLVLGFERTYEGIRDFAGGVEDAIHATGTLGVAYEGLKGSLFGIADTNITVARTLEDSSSAAHDTAFAWGEMVEQGAAAALQAQNLNDALSRLHETQLAMADANIAVAQGWIDLKDELKDGAKTLELSTQAGIDNQRAILGMVGALEQQRQQAIETGGGTQDAIDQANAAYNRQVEALRQAAYAAGFNKQQVDALIASLGAVPPSTTAKVQVPGLAESLRQGESLRQRLDQIDGRVAEANVYVYYHQRGQALNAPLRTGGIAHAATGGAQGGLTEVGEEGPELMRLPTGTMVYPRANRNQMTAAAGSGGGGRVATEVVFGGDLSNPFAQWFMAAQRDGDIQILSTVIVN